MWANITLLSPVSYRVQLGTESSAPYILGWRKVIFYILHTPGRWMLYLLQLLRGCLFLKAPREDTASKRWQSLAPCWILSGANQPGVWSPWRLPNSPPPQDWATSGTNCEPGTPSEVCFDSVLISFLPTEKFLLLTLWRTGPRCLCWFPGALMDQSIRTSHNTNLSTFPVTVHAYKNWLIFTQNKVPACFPSLLQISCIAIVNLKGV